MRVDPGIFARINEINSGRLEKKRGNPGIQVRKRKINSGELEKKGEIPEKPEIYPGTKLRKKQIKKTKKEAKV